MPSPRKPLLPADAAAFIRGDDPTPVADTQIRVEMAKPASETEARVRFTVDLPRSLHKRLKQAALDRDRKMTDLARVALEEWLDTQA
ncbi:MAG: ParG [Cyanobacteriota bacterium]